MNINRHFQQIAMALHNRFMKERFDLFLRTVSPEPGTTIVDLGGYDGSFMECFGSRLSHYNICIADIDPVGLAKAEKKGFKTVLLHEGRPFPFMEGEIDYIFCNSVLEHVTIPKSQIWNIKNTQEFRKEALAQQKIFAEQICRTAKYYFVQTPHRYFPIESHTWFPLTAQLPRPMQIRLIKFLNRNWPKRTSPDYYLLDAGEMAELFPDANILVNHLFGFPKELIAYRTSNKEKRE